MDNAAQIMQGQTPGRLNDVGILQAEEVARKMANECIDGNLTYNASVEKRLVRKVSWFHCF